MRRGTFAVPLLVTTLALPPALGAVGQETPPPNPPGADVPTFGVGTAAVTLDVVVRDKKGKAVRDLSAADFEVFEDNVKQSVDSFNVFGSRKEEPEVAGAAPKTSAPAPAAPPVPSAAAAAAAGEPENRAQLIAFVFDRLTAGARDMAHKAALTYLDRGHVEGDLVGVFSIDLSLRTLQPFTEEVGLIRAGLERARSQANTDFSSNRELTRNTVDQFAAAQQTTDSTTGAAASGPGSGMSGQELGAVAGAAALNQAVTGFQIQMQRSFEALERDQQGYASTNGLLAVVNGLRPLPGRKTVVFFSEGLAIPPNVVARFRDVIHNANRAHVSVYAMDAGGLRVQSANEETRKEMLQAAAQRVRQLESGTNQAAGGAMTKGLERNEDLLRLNPESGLGQLANETGGFLIRDTNDAGSAFARIQEDMRFHYLLSYNPSNENYDGRFRTITVKVNRPGVHVQTREGYYAVRPTESAPLKAFEAPAIAELDRSPRPEQFPLRAAGLSFPEPTRPGLVPVLVEVPGDVVTYVLDKADKSGKKVHRADFTIVVRIRDEAQHEADRVSQHYVLSAAEADVAKARKGQILFYKESELKAGRYNLEAVAYDANSRKAAVRTATLEVPRLEAQHLQVSSLVLIDRTEQAQPPSDNKNPLYYGNILVYPNLGEPYKKSSASALGFFFTAYTSDPKAPAKAVVEVMRGKEVVGQATTPLAAADASGRIQHGGAVPLQNFPPGPYELKVSVSDGKSLEVRQARFTIAE
jgi:VWFA-related protein